jgi:hypothetical protein
MDIIRTQKKENTLQEYHIYKINKNNLNMKDTNINTRNPIFRTLKEMNTYTTVLYKTEPNTRNIQNNYTKQQKKTNTPTEYK